MSQAVWTGSISFGLVNIPVRLYPATEPKDVRFHLYDRRTGKRVRYERVTRADEPATFVPDESSVDRADDVPSWAARETPSTFRDHGDGMPAMHPSEPVEAAEIVRGAELPGGDLVTVTNDELVSIAPERSRTIEIEEFVDLAEIDPVFFEKSYHVAPARAAGAEKPYVLLLRAMQAARMVGIGRFVMRTRPKLVAIRALENAIGLETLYFGDEVRAAGELTAGLARVDVSDRELKTARQLIGAMASTWYPERHADHYREELLELLRSKAPAAPAEPAVERGDVVVGDLMAKLRASVEAAKQKSPKVGRSKKAG
jgi:DNA end-binding protein Ku